MSETTVGKERKIQLREEEWIRREDVWEDHLKGKGADCTQALSG